MMYHIVHPYLSSYHQIFATYSSSCLQINICAMGHWESYPLISALWVASPTHHLRAHGMDLYGPLGKVWMLAYLAAPAKPGPLPRQVL